MHSPYTIRIVSIQVMLFRLFFGLGLSAIVWLALPNSQETRGVAIMIALCPVSTMSVRYALLFDYRY
jgi:hypothetical protein